MSQNPFQKSSSTPFSSGDILNFKPEGRSQSLGTREEGLARQAVYNSFVDREALGHAEVLLRDLEQRGINIESMRREMLGYSEKAPAGVEPTETHATPQVQTLPPRDPNEYYVPDHYHEEKEAA